LNIRIEITGNILKYIDAKVKVGMYKSRSEVVREAIREMLRNDLQAQLKAKGLTMGDLDKLRDEVAGKIIAKKHKKLVRSGN
jgi:putative addiction module CopG family antidote